MKVLTIKQPYASLILKGYKEYEFRTWKTKYRGDILIHAGKTIDKKALEKRFKGYDLGDMPTGVIIGKVILVDCVNVNKEFADKMKKVDKNVYQLDEYINNIYGWKLENIEGIKPYIIVKGQLGLWNYDVDKF